MPSPYSVAKAKHASMANGAIAEQATITGEYSVAQFVNRDASRTFSVRYGAAPTPAAYLGDDTYVVPPGGILTMVDLEADPSQTSGVDLVVSFISDGGTPAFSVQVF